MDARPDSLNGMLLSANRFMIPEYQRPYVWSKEEVVQLWDDLWESFEDSCGSEATADNSEGYFLGPVVVATVKDSMSAPLAHVVDGQQRLTTLNVLMKIIQNRLQESTDQEMKERADVVSYVFLAPGGKHPRLKVAGRDAGNFSAVAQGGTLDETTCLGVAARFLREQVAAKSDTELADFSTFLLNRTRFVFVQTGSFSSAWELFIGLNGKGRPLSPADLIKAYVCGMSVDSESFSGIWEQSVLPLGNDATSAILDTVRMATGEVGSDAMLFKMVERALPSKKLDADMIRIGAEAYYRFWIKPLDELVAEEGLNTARIRALRSLREMRRRDISPVLIALAKAHGFSIMFDATLLQALDSYQLRMAICGKRGKERQFTAIAHETMMNGMPADAAVAYLVRQMEPLMPPEQTVSEAIRGSAYRGRVMLHIVKSYEEGLRGDVRIDDVWYEHVMPQTPTEFWYGAAGTTDPNTYARIVNNIGNITPLDPTTNIKGSNDPWGTKRLLFMNEVPNWLAAEIARKNPDKWTPEQIAARAVDIAAWAVGIRWPLSRLAAAPSLPTS